MHYAYIINGNGRGYIPLVVKIEKIYANYKEEKDEER